MVASWQTVDQACQYCSITSKVNREDPIGTAITARLWLLIEVPQPWAKNPWAQSSPELLMLFAQIERRPRLWRDLRILAIAPDKTTSTKDKRHLFFYQQPPEAAATYRQWHYHIPIEQLVPLVRALLFKPKETDTFVPYRQPSARALFVCTHTRYDLACGRFGTPLYRTLRDRYAESKALSEPLSVWQTTHFGGHNFAPTLIDFPTGQLWGHLEPEILDTLIYRKGKVSELEPFYRGWSGMSSWAQIAERSLWMQQGWDWLAQPRSARIIRRDPGKLSHRLLRWVLPWIPMIRAQVLAKKLEKKLRWAEVEICWKAPEIGAEQNIGQQPTERYRARVEVSHQVMSQMKSGTSESLIPVAQYKVSEIS
ncbi:sucrase ferredoxin [cf. Phormidesmis sp. LEGE 11477]|uniref:sucrase ferredoxin n=1 Tax=cf. Phormidesmis sp. LEGE 11477 TaxID=1828680 RepID=UPI001880342A|nr:sucrase ferredoxin [cf. Phormidesmis sp. LEGE 11477]MBE9064275.1 sucrase ferredoxin [cf. Phormidesmis sp. LEGE 11477]